MSGKTRSLFGTAFKHFLNSLKPRASPGVLVGADRHGNKYYEIQADPSRGKRYPKRWLVPLSEAKYKEEMISFEWNAWLRNRRADPPSESEIMGNASYSKMLKENADKLDGKEGKKVDESAKHTNMSSYPVYEEYEVTPGDKQDDGNPVRVRASTTTTGLPWSVSVQPAVNCTNRVRNIVLRLDLNPS